MHPHPPPVAAIRPPLLSSGENIVEGSSSFTLVLKGENPQELLDAPAIGSRSIPAAEESLRTK